MKNNINKDPISLIKKLFYISIIFFSCSISYSILSLKLHIFYTIYIYSTFFKIFLNSLYIPCIGIIIYLLIKNKYIKQLFSLIYFSLFYLFLFIFLIHFKYFQTLPEISKFNQINLLPEILKQIFVQIINYEEILIFFFFIITLNILFLLKYTVMNKIRCLFSFLIVITIFFIQTSILFNKQSNILKSVNVNILMQYDITTAYKTYGFLPIIFLQIKNFLIPYNNQNKHINKFPGKINPNTISYISSYRNYNVIILQIESLDNWVIEKKIINKYVMPFLHNLKSRSIYFKNFFAQHSGGGTCDAELCSMTSLLPLPNRMGLLSAGHNNINSLPKVLSTQGYLNVAMHANRGSYFNRNFSYPKIGFDKFYTQSDYSNNAGGWHSKDIHFFKESFEKLKNFQSPFFLYMITMQSHGPFDNHSQTSFPQINFKKNNLLNHYIITMNEVDSAMKWFVTKLDNEGYLDSTILIIYSDHLSNVKKNKVLTKENIPAMIFIKSLPPQNKEKVCSHIDIAPTICHLLGISEPDNWLGSSMMNNNKGGVLFNDLSYISMQNDSLVLKKNNHYLKSLNYSFSILK